MRKPCYISLLIIAVFAVFLSGCTGTSSEESTITQTEVSGSAVPAIVEEQAQDQYSNLVLIDPDSLAMETRFKYDDETGKAYTSFDLDYKNTIAVWLMKGVERFDYYFTTTEIGSMDHLTRVVPKEGNKFFLVTVCSAVLKGYVYSPPHWDFTLIDQDGNTYSPNNILCEDFEGDEISLAVGDESWVYSYNHDISVSYKLQDLAKIYTQQRLPYDDDVETQQAAIVFEVPENFNRDYSYITLDLAHAEPVWSLAPIHCGVNVIKEGFGKVKATFQGGSGVESIKDVTLRVFIDDGTIKEAIIEPVINAEGVVEGTKGVDERVQIIVNKYSGEQFLIFDDYVKSRTYG